jgi:hypothetical protein
MVIPLLMNWTTPVGAAPLLVGPVTRAVNTTDPPEVITLVDAESEVEEVVGEMSRVRGRLVPAMKLLSPA